MRPATPLLSLLVAALAACGDPGEGRDTQASAASINPPTGLTLPPATSEGSGSGGASTSGAATDAATTLDPSAGLTGGVKFDVGQDSGGVGSSGGQAGGCQKIDFLFVVDNSGSMADEQEALANSFDGFISSIQNTVMAEDYHIMVIDTDAANAAFEECLVLCAVLPECQGYPCNMLPVPMGCDATLGTGLTKNPQNDECGVLGGKRYMVDGQPDLAGTFSCLAKVGTSGDGSERPMEAMVTAVTALNGAGKCNEGFLRKDAILVVTFITDEEDEGKSNGNPAGWQAALVAAKYGLETSIVVLGLIGDPDQPNAVCTDGAEASPRLRTFAESFTYGSWASICSLDYAPFFDAAVSVVDTACQQFEPPG